MRFLPCLPGGNSRRLLAGRARAVAPNGSAAHSLPGPDDTTRAVLDNGIVVLARPNFDSPSVVINGYLPSGCLFDPRDKLGLADFTAIALMRGTAGRSFQEIYDTLETCGASLGYSGGTHTTRFGGRSLVEDLEMLLDLLGETMCQPSFPTDQVERLRAQILTGLAIRDQDTTENAARLFDQIVYKDHPYSLPEEGDPETVKAIRREDLVDFHARHYGPRGMVIAIVGGIEPQHAVEQIARVLGNWQNPHQPEPLEVPTPAPLTEIVRARKILPGKSQVDMVLGAAGPRRSEADFIPASLGNNIFGQFGMYGRIGEVVREQSGLAYYAYSSLGGGSGPGPWCVWAGVDPANVELTLDLIRKEIARFINEPVSEEELSDTKANYIGSLPLSLESNGGVASALVNLERHALGLDYYRRYAGMISAVTAEDLLAAARHYLDPDRLGIGLAGPKSDP